MSDRRPNILLITTDQQRFDALGLNGNAILRTPNLDALAAGGTNFTRCYVTCPVCIPARRTLLSGLHPRTHGLLGYREGLDFDPPCTLPGVLREAGYQTQLVGKLHLQPQRKRFGFDHMILSESANDRPRAEHQRENDYTTWLAAQGVKSHGNAHGVGSNSRVARPFHLDEPLHHTSWCAQQAARFIDGWRDPTVPWFMHLSFVAPHPPLTPPRDYWRRYVNEPNMQPRIGDWAPTGPPRAGLSPDSAVGPFDPRDMHDAMAGYYGLINHIDDQIAYLLERTFGLSGPARGEPTWIIFSSDHGEMLGDHHLYRKSLAYEGSAHVPLFITGRNVESRKQSVDALVTWEDIMPTILDLAGVTIPDGLDGRSLLAVMRGQATSVRETIFGVCRGFDHDYLIRGRHKYIRYHKTGEEQLFDLESDPHEMHDVSGNAADLTPLRRELSAYLKQHGEQVDESRLHACANQPPQVFWG